MKILLYGDTQICPHSEWSKPVERGLTSKLSMYLKFFSWINELIDSEKPDVCIHLGDVFENGNSVDTLSMFTAAEAFHSQDRYLGINHVEDYKLVGNHDVYSRDASVHTLAILPGTAISSLRTRTFKDKLTILFVPWGTKEGDLDEMLSDLETGALSNTKIIVSHVEIEGADLTPGVAQVRGVPLDKFKYPTFSGHYHHPDKKGNVTFVGCPFYLDYRDQITPIPRGVLIYDTESKETILHPNPHTK